MKWTDDLLMEHMPHRRKVLQMCMYAIHLASGSTLLCRRISASTVKNYVRDVAKFFCRVGEHPMDPRKTEDQTGFDPMLQSIYRELERWEKVPNRREPFTVEMLHAMDDTKVFGVHGFFSEWAVCRDFFELGLRLGLRLTEWAQDTKPADISSYLLNLYGDARAFCVNDFRFETTHRRRVRGAAALDYDVQDLRKCWVKFRTQKNGENGEEKLVTGAAVAVVYRIIKRFVQLCSASDTTTPVAIFKDDKTSELRFVTASIIEKTMRQVAAHVYNLDPIKNKEDLQRWSAHSLRVGACVILHTMGFTATQIKFLLRWKSDTFMMYLRNIAILSNQQDSAIDKLAAMPELI